MSNLEALTFLSSLPASTTIAWNSHHVKYGFSYGGWIDIDCPMLAAAAKWNWCWTVEDPRYSDMGKEELDEFSFVVDFDAQLHMFLDEGKTSGVPCKLILECDNTKKDISSILLEEQEGFQQSCPDDWEQQMTWAWQSHQSTTVDLFGDDSRAFEAPAVIEQISDTEHIVTCPVWTPAAISNGLKQWAAHRGFDLDFVYKEDIEAPEYIQEVFKHLEDRKDTPE